MRWSQLTYFSGCTITPTRLYSICSTNGRIASVYALKATPFARYFPDLANILLRRVDGGAQDSSSKVYSIVHNREHENVSWISAESLRLAPFQDMLTIREGILGAYPNMFFVLDEVQADAFSRAAAAIKSYADYDRLVARYGISRSDDRFWAVYDEINAIASRMQPVASGTLDLTRYELAER